LSETAPSSDSVGDDVAAMDSDLPGRTTSLRSPKETTSNRDIHEAHALRDLELTFQDISIDRVECGSSDSDYGSIPPPRPRHGRSLSHPFYSIFTGRRDRRKKKAEADEDASGTEPQCELPTGISHAQQAGRPSDAAPPRRDGRDFSTGNCMTCGSLVRWPRELSTFKCTICSTINDIEAAAVDDAVACSAPDPVSLVRTRLLIRHCIHKYLVEAIASKERARPSRANLHQPPPSPTGSGDRRQGPRQGPASAQVLPVSKWNTSIIGTRSAVPETSYFGSGHATSSSSISPQASVSPGGDELPLPGARSRQRLADEDSRAIFKPLEDYIIKCLSSTHCLHASFRSRHASSGANYAYAPAKAMTTRTRRQTMSFPEKPRGHSRGQHSDAVELDAKMLLAGDVAENSTWWVTEDDEFHTSGCPSDKRPTKSDIGGHIDSIDWVELDDWYRAINNASETWTAVFEELTGRLPQSDSMYQFLDTQLLRGQDHTRGVILKSAEKLLKRPRQCISTANDLRFLLILLGNPLLRGMTGKDQDIHQSLASSPRARGSDVKRGNGPVHGQNVSYGARALDKPHQIVLDCARHVLSSLAISFASGSMPMVGMANLRCCSPVSSKE